MAVLREEFLHHIWKFGLFNQRDLTTTDGKPVRIIHAGTHNQNSGPDFFNAQLVISDTTWAGNVEIHIQEKDWVRHNHQSDDAYNNVVLHVVYRADGESRNAMGNSIPVIELAGRISLRQVELYESFLASQHYIPCESSIFRVDEWLVSGWLERLLVERLERKSSAVLMRLEKNTGNWQQTLFEQIALNFGFKVNAQPMEMMARSIPVKLIAQYQHNQLLVEALLFGQAGFLNGLYADKYPQVLQNEYIFLQKKHRLIPMNTVGWKFGKMRPANFPTIRIAQFAALMHRAEGLFSTIIEKPDADQLLKIFTVRASDYWNDHHHFDKSGAKSIIRKLGKSSRENMLINTVVPFLFAYSKRMGNELHVEKAMQILEKLPAENNNVITKLAAINLSAGNAARSQALLELKNRYCDQKKCLNCAVGNQLLKTVPNDFSN